MGRFSDTFVSIVAPPIFPNISDPYNSNTTQRHMSSVLKLNKTFSATLVGEFLFSWNRFFHYRTQLSTLNFNPHRSGFPRVYRRQQPDSGFPSNQHRRDVANRRIHL